MDGTSTQSASPPNWLKGIALLAMVFGLATLFSGGSVVFGVGQAREQAGAYVPFVVWFNFLVGLPYVVAGIGIWLGRRWAFGLSALIAAATLAIALAFGIQVLAGGAYEGRTVGALALRTGFWAVIALVLSYRARRS